MSGQVVEMRRLRKAVMGLVVALLVLVGLNLLAMGTEYLRYGTVHLRGAPSGLYEEGRMPGQGVRLHPGAVLNGWEHRVSINTRGFRGAELTEPRPPDLVRIWCAGGSTTFDILVRDNDHAWPARLQTHLRARGSSPVEVINAGVPGEILSTNQRDLREKFASVRPDVLIIYSGVNDLRHLAAEHFGPPPIKQGLSILGDVSLYRQLSDLLPPPRTPASWDQNRLSPEALGPLRQQIERLIQEARQHQMKVVLSSHAFAGADDASPEAAYRQMGDISSTYRMSPLGLIAAYNAMNDMIRRLAEQQSLPFVDIRTAVGTDPAMWNDSIHFSNQGADRAGQAFAEHLQQQHPDWLRR